MEEVANRWRHIVDTDFGGIQPWVEDDHNNNNDNNNIDNDNSNNNDNTVTSTVVDSEKEQLIQLIQDTAYFDDDDDEEDEFDDDDDSMMTSQQIMETIDATKNNNNNSSSSSNDIVSPFDNNNDNNKEVQSMPILDENGQLEFNVDNVHKVLDEIRPYLISDGGNVSVQKVDIETKNVYLKLEGACGSCASSTVTMSMGIKRVLKENFSDLGEVIQVEDDDQGNINGESNSNELTMEAVMTEINRIGPAITAMGGTVEVVSVDPIGVVELKFRGSTKIQQGVELAIRDVPRVKHVKFVNE